MKLYHVDRHNQLDLFIGSSLPLIDNVISFHGAAYSIPIPLDGSPNCYSFLIEHFFDLVREARFPNTPSRFRSFFACEYKELREWKEPLGLHENSAIYEVEGADQMRFDGQLLRLGFLINGMSSFNPWFANTCANAYWQHSSFENLRHNLAQVDFGPPSPPKWEYLVQFPVHILRKLSKDEVADILDLKPNVEEASKNP